jgi:hypothetical protein
MFIELTRGYQTEIDDCDYDRFFVYCLKDGRELTLRVCDLKWHVHTPPHTQYARSGYGSQPRVFVHLHRLLIEASPRAMVDHIDRNGLNNRRFNLRIVTPHESRLNTRKKTAKNRYRGVYWHKGQRKWYARITSNGKTSWLGAFFSEIEAARAYDHAAARLHGSFAELNLPT